MHLATPMSVFAYVSGHICFCQCIWPPQYLFFALYLANSVSVFAYASGHPSICICLCIWPPQYVFAKVFGHTNVFLLMCLAFSPGHIHDHAESVGHVYPILCHHNITKHNSTHSLVVKKIFTKTPVLLYKRYKTSP